VTQCYSLGAVRSTGDYAGGLARRTTAVRPTATAGGRAGAVDEGTDSPFLRSVLPQQSGDGGMPSSAVMAARDERRE